MIALRDQMMLLLRPWRTFCFIGALLSVLSEFQGLGAEKKILLRNETITTNGRERQSLRVQATTSGRSLYLLQLTDNPPANWRAQLANLQVELLRAVPQDAFVTEIDAADLLKVHQLEFVQWMGPYVADYKVHSSVQKMLADRPRVRISAVLSPKATSLETALLQRQFSILRRYSKFRFGRVLEGEVSLSGLMSLKQSKAVLWIEPAANPKLYDAVADQIIAGAGTETGVAVHELGFDGKGVVVAVADSGLNLGEGQPMHPDLEGRVDAFFYYGNLLDASDEHGHGTHVAGIIAGNGASGETDDNGFLYGLGMAPKAHIIAQRIFDGVGGYEPPDSLSQLTVDAVRAGAVIGSNSWGDDTQGRYDNNAMEFDALVRDADPGTPGDQPYILEFSAGNAGPGERTVGSPAVAKNVIATGASQNNRFDFIIYAEGEDSMADFSSRGPCEDGRIKPDLVAPGTWISSLQSQGASDENAWSPISSLYQYEGGTSQAGPHASGSAAVFVQYYRETHSGQTPSPALVKAALINSATDMDNSITPAQGGTAEVPNNDEGWGRIDLTQLIGSSRKYGYVDQLSLLTNGQVFEQQVVVASTDEPLKITLTYTDVPGFPAAIPALVNDLDLEVISPSGVHYRGNQFLSGESVPNAGSFDSINNVEAVHIALPEPGEYLVRVIARRVLEDARKETVAVDQDFALVFSGDLPAPGQGVVALDRKAYHVPANIQLKLVDFDLARQTSATLTVRSSSQTNGLAVTLSPSGTAGVFTGSVATATLPLSADGKLHIQHGDKIEALYQDSSPPATFIAEARADLIAPQITRVIATNHFGKELVTWATDEPARSTVFYRTNAGPWLTVSNNVLATEHELPLDRLVAGQIYQFFVTSIDEADNRGTNDAAGAFYTFVAKPAATVLLVNAYTYEESTDREDVPVPLSSYTDALNHTGISYEVWDVPKNGSPKLDDLKPFRVAIWRINDSFWEGANTITSAQQEVISQYLAAGGSFLMSSMEILTRLGSVPFRTNVLQVATFTAGEPDPFCGVSDCPSCDQDHTVPSAEGATGESLTGGMEFTLDYTNYPINDGFGFCPTIGPDIGDVFGPTTNAVPIFFSPDGRVAGIRSPRAGQNSTGRVVYLSFPLDAIPLDDPPPNNRATVLRNLLRFLAPGINGLGSVSLNNTIYTAPSLVTIEVADSDLLGTPSVQVKCRNRTSGEQITVELNPTVQAGLYRGIFTLVRTNQPSGPEKLRVADGDEISADYLDDSTKSVVSAAADIDLGLPQIKNVKMEAEYETATISWDTDELTDGLVQFGESTFLGKTAYEATLSDAHSHILTSLIPDKLYFFQIVSRDAAGNTVVDDNGGKFYTFRTLKPLTSPWIEDMERGPGDWSIQDGEGNEASWTLGTPNNDLDHSAHSGTNVWGTNLKGETRSLVQTYLVSPAVELKGGNLATLTFWHNYDFFSNDSQTETGTLLLFTNTQTQPITLATYTDSTSGWEQEEFDLTPYFGRIVHIVWEYNLIDFEGGAHPGWLLDDVEINVSTISRGSIRVTNNLAAASFTLDGPTPFTGTGRSLIRSNVITGQYVITYTPIPYYITPDPQTNTLAANAQMTFSGTYTFPDVNQNGISDLWEQDVFQEVSLQRTAQTDTDKDGMVDLAEFVAGTNPLDATSRLALAQAEILSGNRLKLTWPSVEGKTYTISGSNDCQKWQAFSPQLRATGSETSYTLALPMQKRCFLFRVQVDP